MINFEVKLTNLNLYIDDQYEEIANKFCNHGKAKSKNEHKLKTWFEGFIYTALIGININSRVKYKNKKEKFRRWSTFVDQLSFVFMKTLSRGDVRKELNILEFEQIKSDFDGIDELIAKTFVVIGEYSNGGLKYLQERYENNNSLFDGLYALENIYKETIPDIDERELELNEEQERTTSLIHGGESTEVEFKSTLRVNLHTGKAHKDREDDCMKALAAFMNSKGGTLLIGVKDDQEILGLETDFNSFTKRKDKLDAFQLHLDTILDRSFSSSCFSLLTVNFPVINDKTVCKIIVKPARKASYFEKTKFFIRRNASSKELLAGEMMDYINEHFK
jgi:hypothetical protein